MEDKKMARCLTNLAEGGDLREDHLEYLRRATVSDPAGKAISSLGCDVRRLFNTRLEWFRNTCYISPRTTLTVSGRREEALVSSVELWRFYIPLGLSLLRRAQADDSVRVLAGVSGPPGSGKSVFSALLAEVINAAGETGNLRAETCSLDGFHFANEYLQTHKVKDGAEEKPLQSIKGAPETFNVESFLRALDSLRAESTVSVPRYDRELHEPLPDGTEIGPADLIVIVEGNYLLLQEGKWAEVAGRLDPCVFLKIPLEAVKPRIIERHLRGGRDQESAERHFECVDRRNYDTCIDCASRANLTIWRNADQRIERVS